jgi:hypothetical protein
MTSKRERERIAKRLASELESVACWDEGNFQRQQLDVLLIDVPRHLAMAAIETAIDEINKGIIRWTEHLESTVAKGRVGIATLERLRPTIFRGGFKVVGVADDIANKQSPDAVSAEASHQQFHHEEGTPGQQAD